ncbi:MAG: GMC oxidoreductase [Acidobacteriota bacterium]
MTRKNEAKDDRQRSVEQQAARNAKITSYIGRFRKSHAPLPKGHEVGARIILLEAGREVHPSELPTHRWPWELPHRKSFEERQGLLYPDDIRQSIEYQGDRISADRIRVLGGRTVHWNANSFRFSADDFQEKSVNDIEENWPLTYDELAPFYSSVEKTIGVCGTPEGLAVLPDGEFLAPPPNFRCSEVIAQKSCQRLGIRVIPTRKALLTRPYDSRPSCHYCGHCMDICDIGAIFTSANSLIPKALKTGTLRLRMNALARRIFVDKEGKAAGVSFVDRETGKEEKVYAQVIVVSCSTVESARLLLNSTCELYPNGLGNSNDHVGRYFHGHSVASFFGYLESLVGTVPVNNDGATDHSYIPRFNHLRGTTGYKGGFGVQIQTASFMYPHHAHRLPGFGTGFKKEVKRLYPALLQMNAYGKVLARWENRVTVNPNHVDNFRIPIPVVHFEFCDSDRALYKDMIAHVEEIYRTAGVELLFKSQQDIAGFASHEVGTCRMGKDPKTSVLNPFCQSHEVPNLFVIDGSCFVTFPEKNPTLTIMALAKRSARHIVEERRKGNL